MEREVGGGIGMGNTCKPMAVLFQCMTKFTTNKKKKKKTEEPEIELPTSNGSYKKTDTSRKTYISALLTMPKPLTVWITINCGQF